MNVGLEGRVALVTGASRGIGSAIAAALAAEGARVAVGYKTHAQGAEDVVSGIHRAGGRAMPVQLDVLDRAGLPGTIARIADAWGPVEVLVNNGGAFPTPGLFGDLSDAGWQTALRDQLEGPGNVIRAVLAGMQGIGWGRIVSISTVHALTGNPGVVAHTAAKSGLHGLTRSLAKEVGRDGILVNAVLPGLTLTAEALERFPAERIDEASRAIPTGHPSSPADVAALVTFLSSAANGNVTGELIRCSGGL